MQFIEIAANDVHTLLGVQTWWTQHRTRISDKTHVHRILMFEFMGAADPNIATTQKLLNKITGFAYPKEKHPVVNVKNSRVADHLKSIGQGVAVMPKTEVMAAPERLILVGRQEPVMAPLRQLATQYLARKDFFPAEKYGHPVFRLALPFVQSQLPYQTEDVVSETRRISTACNILDLQFDISHSTLTNGLCMKFDEPAGVGTILRILGQHANVRGNAFISVQTPYRIRLD